jgi:hypothetical protein
MRAFIVVVPSYVPLLTTFVSHLCDLIALGYLVSTFDDHRVLSLKTTLTMPPR